MKLSKIIITSVLLVCLVLIAAPKIYIPSFMQFLGSSEKIESVYGDFDIENIPDKKNEKIKLYAYQVSGYLPFIEDTYIVIRDNIYASYDEERVSVEFRTGNDWIKEADNNE